MELEMMDVMAECMKCKNIIHIQMTKDQMNRLELGEEKVQDILPIGQYTPAQREMFISRMCGECWSQMFSEDDDDIDDDLEWLQNADPEIYN